MTEVDLIKALPGAGTIVAFIVVVVLFLRQQEKIDNRMDVTTKIFAQQIKEFIDDVLEVTRNTIVAIEGLEDAVRDLRTQIKER